MGTKIFERCPTCGGPMTISLLNALGRECDIIIRLRCPWPHSEEMVKAAELEKKARQHLLVKE